MKSQSLFITLILFSVLSILAISTTVVYASIDVNTYTPSKDFILSSASDTISMCSCAQYTDTITVTNTGTWPAIFGIATNNIDSKLMVSEKSFELSPGDSRNVLFYITGECNKGSEDLIITVTSNLGTQKSIEKKIVRDRCQNIEAWTGNDTPEVNPCKPTTFEINVHNVGPFQEDYTINSNYDDNIKYNTKAFTLAPNQYVKVTATASFDCSVYGQKDIKFDINSIKNKLTASINTPLTISRNYDYDIKINKDANNTVALQVCNRILTTQIPVSITNKGSVANNYTVEISGLPGFAKVMGLDKKTFSLNPGDTKTFIIDVDSTVYRYEHKNKEITIEVTPTLGDIVKESKLSLNFLACYEHQVVIYDGDKSAKYPLETCAGNIYKYDVEVINNGAFKQTYALSLDGAPSTVKLSKNSVTVEPGKRETVKLLITGPEYNTYYNIKVKATVLDSLTESADTWIKSYDTQSCHVTSVDKTNYNINYQAQSINVPVTNHGLVDNKYIVSWNGSGIVESGDKLVDVNKSETKSVNFKVSPAGRNQTTYSGSIIVEDSSGATYSQDVSVNLKDKSTVTKAFEYLLYGTVCRQFSLYEMFAILLVIILIIIFLFIGPNYPYKFWNRFKAKTSVLVFLIVLFLVGLVLVITFAGFPQTQTQVYNLTTNASELRYEWLQDNTYKLNLAPFFKDPENGTLKYNITGLKHIKSIIGDRSVTFYPDLGWSGIEYAKITAYDKMGGSVTSPDFTLIVRNVPRKPFTELYNIYCWYTNLVIFLILLLFVFIAVFVKQKKRGRK